MYFKACCCVTKGGGNKAIVVVVVGKKLPPRIPCTPPPPAGQVKVEPCSVERGRVRGRGWASSPRDSSPRSWGRRSLGAGQGVGAQNAQEQAPQPSPAQPSPAQGPSRAQGASRMAWPADMQSCKGRHRASPRRPVSLKAPGARRASFFHHSPPVPVFAPLTKQSGVPSRCV